MHGVKSIYLRAFYLLALLLCHHFFSFVVLVALYEETDKPDNALEYPFVMHEGL